jgi:hypothetical protein
MDTGEIQPMRVKECRNRNLMRLTEQSLELVSVLKGASRNFTLIFLFTSQAINLKTICASLENTDFIGLQKISIW